MTVLLSDCLKGESQLAEIIRRKRIECIGECRLLRELRLTPGLGESQVGT